MNENSLNSATHFWLATTKLNKPGVALAEMPSVHAITDVTGFGLACHALELARGAKARVVIEWPKVPLMAGVTGASGRNWAGYGAEVSLAAELPGTAQDLLSDPQTSGGLLVSCDPQSVDKVLRIFRADGFEQAAVVGRVEAGVAGLRVEG